MVCEKLKRFHSIFAKETTRRPELSKKRLEEILDGTVVAMVKLKHMNELDATN